MSNRTSQGKDRGRISALRCPHCQSALRVRSSRQVAPLVRQLLLACFDPECGATFNGDVTINYAVSPSARPNPNVHLRTVSPRNRPANDPRAPANDDGTRPANDDFPIDDARGLEVPRTAISD